MQKILFNPSLIFFLLLFSCNDDPFIKDLECPIEEVSPSVHQNFNVLFLGTNLTAENNIPRIIMNIAEASGDSMFYLTIAPYDFDYQRHCVYEPTIDAINSFKWDYVVLQESGWRVALPPSMTDTMVNDYANALKETIIENNPDTKIILFLTPAFATGVKAVDTQWATDDPDVSNYKGMQNRIRMNNFTLAEEIEASIAPCGELWNICLDNDSTLKLHISDNINPNISGSFISACTLYCTIFRRKIECSCFPLEIEENEAEAFISLITDALFECKPDWREYY